MSTPPKLRVKNLKGKVALITGASRGIGRECALTLARHGANIVIAAKTVKPKKNLPGTIHTVAAEVEALGVEALAVQTDLRDEKAIENCVEQTIKRFGRIDFLINNASALWWQDIVDTPAKKYDLITQINVRGTFLMTKACLPYMKEQNFGRVVTMSPPINLNAMAGHTAYNISKFGMTLVALGVAQEFSESDNITANSLWPATVIESLASINFQLGDRSIWRKASIIADATLGIVCEDASFSGHQLIDDTYLKTRHGFNDQDLVRYRYDPNVEPPRLLDLTPDQVTGTSGSEGKKDRKFVVKRGDVKKLTSDVEREKQVAKGSDTFTTARSRL